MSGSIIYIIYLTVISTLYISCIIYYKKRYDKKLNEILKLEKDIRNRNRQTNRWTTNIGRTFTLPNEPNVFKNDMIGETFEYLGEHHISSKNELVFNCLHLETNTICHCNCDLLDKLIWLDNQTGFRYKFLE